VNNLSNRGALKYLRLLVIGWVFLAMLGCISVKPTPEPTLTPTTPTLPTAMPSPEEAPEPELGSDERQIRQNLLRSTVQLIALIEEGGRLQPLWTGSGTIITPDGFILTNAHVASDPDPAYQPDAMGVAITVRSDEPPELSYLAEVRAVDYRLDLAVVQIVSDLDGRPVDVDQLNLSHAPLGDSDVLELGDMLQILGYPGIGGETITFTRGVVSGFTREYGVKGRAYIKTDATIAGGNSGGLASDADGRLIGVPTQVGYGGAERFADCRYLADTNGDGEIDQDDNCIPVGGFINALRPINLAKSLVDAARLGIAPKLEPGSGPSTGPSGESRFYDLVFAPGVTDNDQPTSIATQLPSGATDIYAFWEYAGMADGMGWEARWYYEGELLEEAGWAPGPWQGGQTGSWWVSIYDTAGLLDGTYRVELYVEDALLLEGAISVGGAASGPTITGLIFSDGVTDDDQPTDPTYLLPSGITRAYAFFDYADMRDGMDWARFWYREGEQVATGSGSWEGGDSGSQWVSLSAKEPLQPGAYRLELAVEGTLVAASDFTIAGTETHEAIGPITFASDVDARGNPVDPGTAFPTGLKKLHFVCTFAGMRDGMDLSERWILNGEELVTFESAWEYGEEGTFHDVIHRTSGDPLLDGEYKLELYVEGQLVQQGTATTGTGGGEPPPPPPPPSQGLFIQGYILDADTGRGIPGALYVVLNPGVTVDGWDGSKAQIHTSAESDANGYFELPLPLERNERYSVIVGAEGYLPVGGDDIPVGDDSSPLQVEVTLQRE
jgi:serine protease Do